MSKMSDLRDSLKEEVATILGPDFAVEVTETQTIPHSGDTKITFPNLDAKKQSCKLIDTCVLYIDMRRSTALSLRLRQHTVAKLYSAFVRAMTRCARHFDGHVRGIIGDRVMVLFDQEDAYTNALDCAFLMNTVAKHILNKHFSNDDVQFGIGIDAGKMLVTKTGIRKQGYEQSNYRNLVWLGKPANFASKLTDIANKPAEIIDLVELLIVYEVPKLFESGTNWTSQREAPHEFVKKLTEDGWPTYKLTHANSYFRGLHVDESTHTIKPKTPPILMSKRVWDGYKAARPNEDSVTKGWIRAVEVKVEGLNGTIYGGDVIFPAMKD